MQCNSKTSKAFFCSDICIAAFVLYRTAEERELRIQKERRRLKYQDFEETIDEDKLEPHTVVSRPSPLYISVSEKKGDINTL
jgi:hypothetical protein